jgi:hypothetical protein
MADFSRNEKNAEIQEHNHEHHEIKKESSNRPEYLKEDEFRPMGNIVHSYRAEPPHHEGHGSTTQDPMWKTQLSPKYEPRKHTRTVPKVLWHNHYPLIPVEPGRVGYCYGAKQGHAEDFEE